MPRSAIRCSVLRPILMISALVSLVAGAASAADPVEITSCGQSFKGEAFLTGDLDCSGFADSAVVIQKGSLDLRGFTIRGGQLHGILCEGRCEVIGNGGTISGAGANGIRNLGSRITITDVTIKENSGTGIGAPLLESRSRVFLSFSTIIDNLGDGIFARSATVSDSTISGNTGAGIFVWKNARVSRSETSNNGDDGVYAEGSAYVTNSVSDNNIDTGVWGVRKAVVSDSQIVGNQHAGVQGQKSIVTKSSVVTNADWGVRGTRWIRAEDSTICGNGTDLLAFKPTTKIKIRSTACDGHQDCTVCPLD